ncbi:MAG TPA: hypothetical protein VKA17_00465 [Gammaproteobacteria bacterium]|nr:hypothetical protein [Gammaproteobacteria bacterium]
MKHIARRLFFAPLAIGLLACGQASAEGFALGAKAGTTGLGLEGTWGLSQSVNLRGGYYFFDYSTELEESGVDYDGDLELQNAALFVDWHPFQGGFRLSAGGVQTGNEFLGFADGDVEVGGNTYTAVLDAKVGWSTFAPYLGLGFGNAVRSGRWSFAFDLGVMFTGTPSVRLEGTVNDPVLQAQFEQDVAQEEAELREELKDAKYFPVLSLGVAYRF